METIPHSPIEGVYPPDGDYVHAMEVRAAERLLFVSGTMGLGADGTPGATLADQTLESDWLVEIEVVAAA